MTASRTVTNAIAQELVTLALPSWGYPPPDLAEDTPQARLDWALNELVGYLRQTAKRARRRELEDANRDAIEAALAALD